MFNAPVALSRFLAGALALVAPFAVSAAGEYVNPVYCYRIIEPVGVSRAEPVSDGHSVVMTAGGVCSGPDCIRVTIDAGYPGGALPRDHGWYAAHGWRLVSTSTRRATASTWHEYALALGGARMSISELADERSGALFVVKVAYGKPDAAAATRTLRSLLDSWRWVSACH